MSNFHKVTWGEILTFSWKDNEMKERKKIVCIIVYFFFFVHDHLIFLVGNIKMSQFQV